jgi:hypothetical protein
MLSGGTLSSPIKVTLELEKEVGIWVKIPCIDNVGSWSVSLRL